jgi:ADP-heptose:LPS heptosyltransferase
MRSSYYREKWLQLLGKSGVEREMVERLSRQVAYSFMDSYLKDCHLENGYVDLLCELTTSFDRAELNQSAAKALFSIIIERLCDEFEDLQTETYNQVMTRVISYCRRLPAGRDLDDSLKRFELHSQDDLLNRIAAIRRRRKHLQPDSDVGKVLLLSRITIGADVAITSVIVQRLSHFFPKAELVLIGSNKLREIYGGNPRLRFEAVDYDRRGGLLERLASWQAVLHVVGTETAGSRAKHTVLVDPDSRLSQLGVLPLIDDDRYYFFNSRSHQSLNRKMSMAQLTNAWLDDLTGEKRTVYPKVWPLTADLEQGAKLSEQLRAAGARNIVTVNFGVGANPRKRVGRNLETKLLLTLVKEPDTVVILDHGYGDEEREQTQALMGFVARQGYPVREVASMDAALPGLASGAVAVRTRLGEITGIIAGSDEYIGYDSAGQHIAAALAIPCLTIFAGSNTMRFIRRWSAYGPNSCQIVHVDTLTNPSAIDVEDIITRIEYQRSLSRTARIELKRANSETT